MLSPFSSGFSFVKVSLIRSFTVYGYVSKSNDMSLYFRNNVDQREALENLDLILLCLDEIVDGG